MNERKVKFKCVPGSVLVLELLMLLLLLRHRHSFVAALIALNFAAKLAVISPSLVHPSHSEEV